MGRPRVLFEQSGIARLHAHARGGYPSEACGLLLGLPCGVDGVRRVAHVLPARNADDSGRRDRFAISPRGFLAWDRLAERMGLVVLGCYHSHPDGLARPSLLDAELAFPDFVYLIAAVSRGVVAETAAWVFDPDVSRFQEATLEVIVSEESIDFVI